MTPEKQKILLVGWGYPPKIDGGLDIHVYHLLEELKQKDSIEIKLALPEDRAPERDEIIPIETGEGDMVWKARKLSAEVAKKAEEFDIIHTHDWFGSEAGFKARKYGDIKWISTVHSLSSNRNYSTSNEIEKMEEVAVKQPDKAITVSKALQDEIRQEFEIEPEVIYNGFSQPSGTGKNVKEELNINGRIIFFVGRHAEQKGIEHLLYGFKKFLDNGNQASLVIGGEGHMTESLKDFTEILGIEDKVFFTGFIPREELGDYYSQADVFVSPSINEPFGLTITEALESNTPVLATESGVSEIVEDGSLIQISPESNSISNGLVKALEQDKAPEYESRSWKDMSDEVLNVYRELN